ncbi:MAG TPA: hypothetical protein VEX68_26685 [Bryobacteraceae bacterium]|nr:hypothetical protein [Bryobacteraceae bacterium]
MPNDYGATSESADHRYSIEGSRQRPDIDDDGIGYWLLRHAVM